MRLESPSTDKAAVDRCGRALADRLRALGGAVDLIPTGGRGDHCPGALRRRRSAGAAARAFRHRVAARHVGADAAAPGRITSLRPGHVRHESRNRDRDARHRRRCDATGTRHPAVVMLWTTDEEIGSGTSRTIIEREARQALAVLVLEPALPGGALKTARKGCGEFELTVHGRRRARRRSIPARARAPFTSSPHQIAAIERLQDLPRGSASTSASSPAAAAERGRRGGARR